MTIVETLREAQAASQQRGDIKTSGGGGTLGSASQAAPAHPGYTVGSLGFGPTWTTEDAMAASIVRLERENEELRAEVALLREERAILERQFGLVAEGLTVRGVPLEELREDFLTKWRRDQEHNDELREQLDEWRECAELLAELAQHPREGEEFIADYVELRARAMGEFRKLKEGGE